MNYYNDNDPFISKWLKELIKSNLIPDGEVDDRSIAEIKPEDLKEYEQHHFFAGIAGWPRALDLAGWDSTRSVWSASLPCQPLSVAGKQLGEKDKERHLWPIFYNLVKHLRPPTIIGEQVASKDGREWLTGIFFDLEALGYAVAAADLPAASVGAPHKRNRLFWVANSNRQRQQGESVCLHKQPGNGKARQEIFKAAGASPTGRVAHTESQRNVRETGATRQEERRQRNPLHGECVGASPTGRLADSERNGRRSNQQGRQAQGRKADGGNNFWTDSVLIPCADGKYRRVPGRVAESNRQHGNDGRHESGDVCRKQRQSTELSRSERHLEIEPALFPLADGFFNRVGTLRGAGNAINPFVGKVFIEAFMECEQHQQDREL